MQTSSELGCLLIGDLVFEPDALAGWQAFLSERGAAVESFRPGTGDVHLSLQRAYQRVRREDGISAILAAGSGCDLAVALAGQLPVDRLALLNPLEWQGRGGLSGSLDRIRRYAWRGADFCVADILLLPGLHTPPELPERWRRELRNSRVHLWEPAEELWTNRKEVLKLTVLQFLLGGKPPKSLAENAEMCIIYG